MEVKNSQYYLYDDPSNTAEVVMIEENTLLKQLEEAVSSSKDERSDEELSAAIGMMLMHYQDVNETQFTPNKKQIEQQKSSLLNPNATITNEHSMQYVRFDMLVQQIRSYRMRNYSKTSVRTSCRDLLKEFFSENSS